MFFIGLDTGLISLQQYNSQTDPKFIEVNVIAFDNTGVEPSLMSSSLVKVSLSPIDTMSRYFSIIMTQVYFIENDNLVILTVASRKSQVDSNLDDIKRLVLS